MTPRDQSIHQILSRIEAYPEITQRRLSRDLGIALGLTNLLLRNLVRQGWVRAVQVERNRVRYLLTPAGIAEKALMSRNAILHALDFYRQMRARFKERLDVLRQETVVLPTQPARVVFWGAGEAAEIAFVCLQGTNLTLVGVVDDERASQSFFGVAIRRVDTLRAWEMDGNAYDYVVVTTLADRESLAQTLADRAIPHDRVFWL
jgi:DNA-binding MarR family transcriptional regulator